MLVPSGDHDGIESSPPVVSCLASFAGLDPDVAGLRVDDRARERDDLGRDDDDVRRSRASRVTAPPPLPSRCRCRRPLVPTNGRSPLSRLSVTSATISRPTIDRTGASQRPTDAVRPRRRRGRAVRHARPRPDGDAPVRDARRPAASGDCPMSPRRGCPAGAIRSHRSAGWSAAPRRRAGRPRGRSRRCPPGRTRCRRGRRGRVGGSAGCDRRSAARTRVTVRPRTATSGSGLPGPHGASPASSR